MFSSMRIFAASLTITVLASVSFAQERQNQTQNQNPQTKERQGPFERGEGRGFHRGPGFGGIFGPDMLRQLNLTDVQSQQIHAIMQQGMESTKSQREELRQLFEKRHDGTLAADDEARAKTLREELRNSMQETQSRIAAVLTAEQRAKLEELIKERKENRERFGERRRREFPPANEQGAPGAETKYKAQLEFRYIVGQDRRRELTGAALVRNQSRSFSSTNSLANFCDCFCLFLFLKITFAHTDVKSC